LESGDFTRESLSLELRCPSCGAVNRYEAKGVIVPGGQHKDVAYLIDDEFPCASCDQEVEFEFTPMAQMALNAELLLAKFAREGGQRQDSRVTLLDCKLDGQIMPLAVGLKKLRDRISNTPTDALAWFQLGNLLAHTNRPKATIQAYRQAAGVAPNAIDAKLMLAMVLRTNQANEEAFTILADALNRSSDWQFLAPYPNFGQAFADLYNHLLRSLGRKDLPVLHPSSVAAPKKVSRNDPCPCGSGKKYKKCCGF
jgi:tetratricopeptide (TPR) repeat protein